MAQAEALLPSKIGRHQVVGYIATGGMAELFLAKEQNGRPVVIKRILPHLARQPSFVSMFVDEARIGALAKHPNLVEVYELGQVGTDLFLCMEYLVGENLAGLVRRLVKRKERMSYGLAAYIVAEVCDGLHAAHELTDERGNRLDLVHRDVSPQNVFVTYGGDVKLLDFGVATAAYRLTQTASGEVKGKYAYMSPEQCRGEPLDNRSDIFSLGTVLYELTTQRRLFKRPNELQVMKAICDEPVPRPSREIDDYPDVLEAICMRALSRNRKDRYATAAEMREDLLAAMTKLGLEGDPHEALASKLARLFGDRIESKRHLLDRVRSGGDLGELLRAEVDEQVDVPIVSHATPTPIGPATPKTHSRLLAAVFAVAIVAGIGVGAWLRERRHEVAAKVIDAGPALAVQVQQLPPAPPPPPAQQYIVITVETDPTGAKLVVDGDDRGTTPVDLRLPKTDSAVHLVLSQPGFESRAQDVVPDRDQRLYFSLKARRGTVRKTPKRPPPPGFHRFD
jgi:eukaryotic-like serine/threonine-protein kinase